MKADASRPGEVASLSAPGCSMDADRGYMVIIVLASYAERTRLAIASMLTIIDFQPSARPFKLPEPASDPSAIQTSHRCGFFILTRLLYPYSPIRDASPLLTCAARRDEYPHAIKPTKRARNVMRKPKSSDDEREIGGDPEPPPLPLLEGLDKGEEEKPGPEVVMTEDGTDPDADGDDKDI